MRSRPLSSRDQRRPPRGAPVLRDDVATESERHLMRSRARGPWVLILGFLLLGSVGSLLLKLPWVAAAGSTISWSDAIFTAFSAITVTGLTVRDTAHTFSPLGHVLILLLIQLGGVGFITFSVLLFRLIGRRITLSTRFLAQQEVGASAASGVVRLALLVLGVTVGIELVGALLLWLRWRTQLPDGQALWFALFQSISTYCNAGFDLFSATDHGPLYGFAGDWYTLLVLSLLIILGGFGITIYYDLLATRRTRLLSLNTRFVLAFTLLLSLGGMLFLLMDPNLHQVVAVDYTSAQRGWQAFFLSVATRTAGIPVVPISELSEGTQLVMMLLMFVGASPASMSGGVSIATVAVLLVAARNTVVGSDPVVFGRALPRETVAKAVAVMTVSTLLVLFVTLLLTIHFQGNVFRLGFEAVSAFSNTGFTLNQTSRLDNFGRLVVGFTMFWGRLGPLTIVVALAQRDRPALVHYPEEAVPLG